MTDLTPIPALTPVPQLETGTLALGGAGGPMNHQAQALLNRIAFVQQLITSLGQPSGGLSIGWERTLLSAQITNTGDALSAQEFTLWEFEHLITDKPNPVDPATWDWQPAYQAAIRAPSAVGHDIRLHEGVMLKSGVVVDRSVRMRGSPFSYGAATVIVPGTFTGILFDVKAHYVTFSDDMIIRGPGKTSSSQAIRVGDGTVNYDMFVMDSNATVFEFGVGCEINTQNWLIAGAAGASTCDVGMKLGGLASAADRRNGYVIGARFHSCNTGVLTTQQWQAMAFIGNDFSSCTKGIEGAFVRSTLSNNIFFNGKGTDVRLTASQNNTLTGNQINGDTTATLADPVGHGFHITGSYTTLSGNSVSNKTGHGYFFDSVSHSSLTGCSALDSDFLNQDLYSGIKINGANNTVTGCPCRTSAGGGTRQKYGIDLSGATGTVCSSNPVQGNKTAGILPGASSNIILANPGYVTENRGTASIAPGATTVVVNHGLSFTPTLANITLVLGNSTNVTKWWVTTITATQFTINVNADPSTGTQFFGWRAQA